MAPHPHPHSVCNISQNFPRVCIVVNQITSHNLVIINKLIFSNRHVAGQDYLHEQSQCQARHLGRLLVDPQYRLAFAGLHTFEITALSSGNLELSACIQCSD